MHGKHGGTLSCGLDTAPDGKVLRVESSVRRKRISGMTLVEVMRWNWAYSLPVLLLMTDPYCSINPVLAMMLPVIAIYHESIESAQELACRINKTWLT